MPAPPLWAKGSSPRTRRDCCFGLAAAARRADKTVELLVDRWIADVEAGVSEIEAWPLERLRQLARISTFTHRRRLVWMLAREEPTSERPRA